MTITDRTLCVVPGPHVVARSADVTLMVFGDAGAALDELLRAVTELAAGPDPGLMLSRRMSAIVTGHDPGALPPFCAVAPTADGAAVVAHGAAEIIVETADGNQVLDGRNSATLVDRVFPGELGMIAARPAGADLPPVDPRFQLRSGVVRGGGAVLVPASRLAPAAAPAPMAGHDHDHAHDHDHGAHGHDHAHEAAPAPEPAPAPAPEAAAAPPAPPEVAAPPEAAAPPAPPVAPAPPTAPTPVIEAAPPPPPPPPPLPAEPPAPPAPEPAAPSFVSVNLLEVGVDDDDVLPGPLPVAGQGHDHEPMPDASHVEIDGVHCVRNHFNNPNSRYCSVCGISMLQQTLRLQKGTRPPLGVFVYDDGSAFSADADYVIGRQPDADPRVASGEARPMIVTDPQRSTSRVHAEIRLSGWDVTVVDRGSANGTWLLPAGATDWQRLTPDTPARVPTGARVRVGQRHFIFESHHVV